MAIEHVMSLSTTEPNNHIGLLKIRQGDDETQQLQVSITKNSIPVDYTGLKPFFMLRTGTTTGIVEQEAEIVDAKNGRISYTLNKYDWQKGGKNIAYFSFRSLLPDNSWEQQFTTRDFEYTVTRDVYSNGITDSNYVWTFEDLLRRLNEFIESGETDFTVFWQMIMDESESNAAELISMLQEFINNGSEEFLEWFETIKDTLGEDAAGELALGIINLQGNLSEIEKNIEHMQNKPVLPIGRIVIPEEFESGVTYTKNSDGKFVNDFSIGKTKDWSNSVEVFITCRVSITGLGDNFNSPISFGRFLANYRSGLYGSAKSFIMTIVDSFYEYNQLSTNGLDCDLYIRSGSIGGFSWFAATKGIWSVGAAISITAWHKEEDELYSTIQTTTDDILDILDRVKYNDEASPNYFTKASSLEECQTKIGTFYQDGAKVYVHKFSETIIDDHALIYSSVMFNLVNYTGKCLVMENIGMIASSYSLRPSSYDTNLYFVKCHFYRGLQNSFEIFGKFDVTLFKCISNGSSADGNNYHGDSGCVAKEIDCVSFDNGTNKVVGGNTSNSSNNASTAHDGMSIFRYNCRYWNSQGGTAADVNDCLSLNIGCEIGNVAEGTLEGDKVSFLFNAAGVTTPKNNQYVLDCNVTGTNIKYAISGTVDTYYLNLKGSTMIQNAKELVGGWS